MGKAQRRSQPAHLTAAARRDSMSFALYLIGYLLFIAGVAYAAHLAHVPQHWIFALILVLAGAGVLTGVKNTRHKDPA